MKFFSKYFSWNRIFAFLIFFYRFILLQPKLSFFETLSVELSIFFPIIESFKQVLYKIIIIIRIFFDIIKKKINKLKVNSIIIFSIIMIKIYLIRGLSWKGFHDMI